MPASSVSPQAIRPPLETVAWGIVLNAAVPVILYKLSKRYFSSSEITALVIAALFPLGKNAFDLLRHRQSDPISMVVLLGIATDRIALLFGRVRLRALARFSSQVLLP